MKRILKRLLLATFIGVAASSASADEINILFLGNSFTARHDLSLLVKEVFEEGQPGLTVNVEAHTYGGQDMFRHHDLYFSESIVRLNTITTPEIDTIIGDIQSLQALGEAPAFYTDYFAEIGETPQDWAEIVSILATAETRQNTLITRIGNNNRMQWDYVVIQSWNDVVTDVDAGYGEYAQKFATLAANEGAQVILYITAPDTQNQEAVTEPLNAEQTEMELAAVRQIAKVINPYAIVPVGLAINNIQTGGTDLKFRYVNDFHPNQYTAFLTANMFYAAFFRESTVGFSFNTVTENNDKGQGEGKDPDGGDATVVFDEVTKEYLQGAAYDAVTQFYATLEPTAPVFSTDPINGTVANVDIAYEGSVAYATDVNSDPLTYSLLEGGPAWLSVSADGVLSGTPADSDLGENSWTVQVTDGALTDTATLNITVEETPAYTTAVVVDLDQASFGGEGPDRAADVDDTASAKTELTYSFSASSSLFTEPGSNAVPIYGGYSVTGEGTVSSDSYLKLNAGGYLESQGKQTTTGTVNSYALLFWDSADFLDDTHRLFTDTEDSSIVVDVKRLVNNRGINVILRDGETYYISELGGVEGGIGTLTVNGTNTNWAPIDPASFASYDPDNASTLGLATGAFESRTFSNVTGVGLIAKANRGSGNASIIEINDFVVSLQESSGPPPPPPDYTTALVVDLDQASFGGEGPSRSPDVDDTASTKNELTYSFSASNPLFTEPGSNAVPVYGGFSVTGEGTVSASSYFKLNAGGYFDSQGQQVAASGGTVNSYALLFWDSADFLDGTHRLFTDAADSSITVSVKRMVNNRGINVILRDGETYYISELGGIATFPGTLSVNGTNTNWAPMDPASFASYDPDNASTLGLATGAFESRTFSNVTGVGLIAKANRGSSNASIIEISDFVVSLQKDNTAPPPPTAPVFSTDPINEPVANVAVAYSGSVAYATDVNGDTLTYSLLEGGPAWLSVSAAGALSGTPAESDLGENSWTVQVSDGELTDTATLNITVEETPPAYTTAVVVNLDQASFGGEGSSRSPDVDDTASTKNELTYSFSASSPLFTEPGSNAVPVYGGFSVTGEGTVSASSYFKLNAGGYFDSQGQQVAESGGTVNSYALLFWDSADFLDGTHRLFADTEDSSIVVSVKRLINNRGINVIIRDGETYYISELGGVESGIGTLTVNGTNTNWAPIDPASFASYDPDNASTLGLATGAFESRTFSNVTGVGLIAKANRGSSNASIIEISDFVVSLQKDGDTPPPPTAPAFSKDPINEAVAKVAVAYSGSVAYATDVNGDTLTYSLLGGGPAWLSVSASGELSGTPAESDLGENSWTVQVSDGELTDTATLNITVEEIPPPPTADYAAFETQYNLQLGYDGDDDGDGVSNFWEYLLNGDPTDATDVGQSDWSFDGSTFSYVFSKNVGDTALTYRLLSTSNLAEGPWVEGGFTSEVEGPVVDGYQELSYTYGTTGTEALFFKLEIAWE